MKRMTRTLQLTFAMALVGGLAPVLLADVKTREKTVVRLEGFLGTMLNRSFGGNDGITSTLAVKGNRMARTANDRTELIDLSEEKVYMVDTRRREYEVRTFAEIRKQMEDARAQMAKQQQEMSAEDKQALQNAAKDVEFDANVRETGQKRALVGHETREVIVTVTMRQRGQTLEESGGLVATTTMWLAPQIPALDELIAFNLKYFKAVFGAETGGLGAQQMNALTALVPGIGTLTARMAAERQKLTGSTLSSTMVFESVKSAEQMKAAQSQQQQSSGGGGIGGALAGRLMRGRGGPPQQRSTVMTSTTDFLAIDTTVTDAEVTIPANFKLKN